VPYGITQCYLRARVFCGMRIAQSCQGVICGKSSAERSANYPLSLFRIPKPKNSAFPRITKLPFARIAQQVCNRCIPSRGPLKNEKNKNGLLDIAVQCCIVLVFGRCTHRTSKIGDIGACWNMGELVLASRRCRCCKNKFADPAGGGGGAAAAARRWRLIAMFKKTGKPAADSN